MAYEATEAWYAWRDRNPLRVRRLERGMTLAFTSAALGLNYNTLFRLETGATRPQHRTAGKLCRHFGADIIDQLKIWWTEKP